MKGMKSKMRLLRKNMFTIFLLSCLSQKARIMYYNSFPRASHLPLDFTVSMFLSSIRSSTGATYLFSYNSHNNARLAGYNRKSKFHKLEAYVLVRTFLHINLKFTFICISFCFLSYSLDSVTI